MRADAGSGCRAGAQGNPELDQLSGRFGHQRGLLGLLLCRQDARRDLTTARCRDKSQDGRGYILVLSDADIGRLLDDVAAGRRSGISRYLELRYDQLALCCLKGLVPSK